MLTDMQKHSHWRSPPHFELNLCVCSAAAALAKKLNVECPIIDGIFRVIHDKAEPLGVSSCMSSGVATLLSTGIALHATST